MWRSQECFGGGGGGGGIPAAPMVGLAAAGGAWAAPTAAGAQALLDQAAASAAVAAPHEPATGQPAAGPLHNLAAMRAAGVVAARLHDNTPQAQAQVVQEWAAVQEAALALAWEQNVEDQQLNPDLSSSALTGRIDLARAMGDSDVDQILNLAGGRGSGAWWAPTWQEASTSSCSSCTARNASP